jgi:predicted RNA binding protein YcfA (HicA-like mRNA interferase family)
MPKFPVDAPIDKVIQALEQLDFRMVRKGNHISMERTNADGTKTPMTIPNHRTIKSSTLRMILTQSGISRADFLDVYEKL